jgi:hypothetical protein
MRVDDRRVVVGHHEARHDARGNRGRNGKDHAVLRRQRNRAVIENELGDDAAVEPDRLEPGPEPNFGAAPRQQS